MPQSSTRASKVVYYIGFRVWTLGGFSGKLFRRYLGVQDLGGFSLQGVRVLRAYGTSIQGPHDCEFVTCLVQGEGYQRLPSLEGSAFF